jgi:hypothetical protein
VRALFSLLVVMIGLALSASQASAQCCYIAPPRAPDMLGPGTYCTNPYGVTYGPNYNVLPPYPPFQGMLLGPQQGPSPADLQMLNGFPRHLYARSPRDFFMVETDPRAITNPYNYGLVSPARVGAGFGGVPAGSPARIED